MPARPPQQQQHNKQAQAITSPLPLRGLANGTPLHSALGMHGAVTATSSTVLEVMSYSLFHCMQLDQT